MVILMTLGKSKIDGHFADFQKLAKKVSWYRFLEITLFQ